MSVQYVVIMWGLIATVAPLALFLLLNCEFGGTKSIKR